MVVECPRCEKGFLTKRALNGHRSMCPENPDRTVPTEWAPDAHGRWGTDESNP